MRSLEDYKEILEVLKSCFKVIFSKIRPNNRTMRQQMLLSCTCREIENEFMESMVRNESNS